MASWKESNTLKALREAKIKWVKKGTGDNYLIEAEGYYPIEYRKYYRNTNVRDNVPYKIQIPGVDDREIGFHARQEAQAYAEDHPKSEFPPITSGSMIKPEAVARSEAKGRNHPGPPQMPVMWTKVKKN